MEQVLIALIGGMPAMLAAIGALIVAIRGNQKIDENTTLTKQTKTVAVEAKQETVEVKNAVNGRMEELLNEARRKAYAEGFAVGQREAIKQIKKEQP